VLFRSVEKVEAITDPDRAERDLPGQIEAGSLANLRLPASCGDRKWFGDGGKRDNAESAGI